MYHSRMLEAAKKIGNLNEFVYLAKEISRMLKEEVTAPTRAAAAGLPIPCPTRRVVHFLRPCLRTVYFRVKWLVTVRFDVAHDCPRMFDPLHVLVAVACAGLAFWNPGDIANILRANHDTWFLSDLQHSSTNVCLCVFMVIPGSSSS